MIKKGDIVLFKPTGTFNDFFIKFVSPNFTHLGIVEDPENMMMIDASFIGGIKRRKYKISDGVVVIRLNHLSDKDIENMLEFLRSKIGNTYNMFGAITAGILRKVGLSFALQDKDKFEHCSELGALTIRQTTHHRYFFTGRAAASVMPDDIAFYEGATSVVF